MSFENVFKRKKVSARTVRKALGRMRSGKANDYDSIDETLSSIWGEMDFGTARLLIEAAGEPFAAKTHVTDPIGHHLLNAATSDETEDRVPLLEVNYLSYTHHKEIQERALRALSNIGSPKAIAVFWKLLKLPESRELDLFSPLLPFKDGSSWRDKAEDYAPHLFPAAFSVVGHCNDLGNLCDLVLKYCELGLLELSDYPEAVDKFLQLTQESLSLRLELDSRVDELQAAEPSCDTESPYSSFPVEQLQAAYKAEQNLEWLLDVFRFIQDKRTEPIIRLALDGLCLHVKTFAVVAALRQKMEVPPRLLEEIAESTSRRATLWQLLKETNLLEHFPNQYRTQYLLAEAEMVNWLIHPCEMNRIPEKLDHQAIVEIEEESQLYHYYLFSFSHPEFHEGKTFVGIAGPYPKEGPPRIGGRWTFSHFKEIDSMSLQQHAATFVDPEDDGVEFKLKHPSDT